MPNCLQGALCLEVFSGRLKRSSGHPWIPTSIFFIRYCISFCCSGNVQLICPDPAVLQLLFQTHKLAKLGRQSMSNSHTVSIHGFVLTSEESRSNVFKWASDIFEHSFSIWATACTTNCFFHGHVCCRPKMPVQMTLNFMCKRGMDESVNGARKIINSEGVSKIVPVQLS